MLRSILQPDGLPLALLTSGLALVCAGAGAELSGCRLTNKGTTAAGALLFLAGIGLHLSGWY